MTKEEFYNEFKDWTKEEILSRAYDICLKNIELQQRTEKAVEILKRYTDNESNYYVPIFELIDILNGRSDE